MTDMTKQKFKNILDADNKQVQGDLLSRCGINNDLASLMDEAARSTQSGKPLPPPLHNILTVWYDSLATGTSDYGVYGYDEYIAELWACWQVYSKNHLRNLIRKQVTGQHANDKVIVDLGCGFGYTTASITQIFSNAKVYGTNLDGTLQMKVAKTMADDYNFTMVDDANKIGKSDLVFASEYFEHFDKPIDHLDYIIECLNPDTMIIANAFGPVAIGHFHTYIVNGELVSAKETGKLFNKRMKHHGFVNTKVGLWNNRPSYWKK